MMKSVNIDEPFSCYREWLDEGIYVAMSGEISSKAMLTVNDPIVGDPRLDAIRFEIWDLTKVTSIIDEEQISSVVYYFDRETSAWSKGLKIALVISCPKIAAVFDEYHELMKNSYWETRTFSSLEDAKSWCAK